MDVKVVGLSWLHSYQGRCYNARNQSEKEVKMKKIGLDKLDVITVFERTFADRVMEDPLINHIARAVGEVIEENNKKLLEEFTGALKGGVSK
ncbi:MAG: hypothetical protein GH158_03175 [Dehalococcoidia bacterium]|nr:hypothetical protein [Dehalococcoidia bacterium]